MKRRTVVYPLRLEPHVKTKLQELIQLSVVKRREFESVSKLIEKAIDELERRHFFG